MSRSRLGPLALEAKLGDDPAHSHVWRAVHIQQRKAVAVKLFSLPFGGTPEAKKDFAHEWDALKRLRHPAIARCYGGGFEGNDAYLAYELVEGETLADQVQRRGRLSWEAVLDLAEPLAEALAHAHDRGVAHGQLVPDKIRLSSDGPVIVDFRLDRNLSLFRSQRPVSAVALAFQAPEVVQDPRSASPKSDLYSLGAVLFYALTGRPPVEGSTPEEVARGTAEQTPPKVAALVLDCPIWLSAVVEQMLQKEPASRPHGAAAVQLALREVRRRAAAGTGVAEHASAGFSPLAIPADRAEARALLGRAADADPEKVDDGAPFYEKAWFLLTSLLLLVGVAAWLLWPPSEATLRRKAEEMLAAGSRTSISQARSLYLDQMLRRFPDGQHADWAREQIDHVEMVEAEHALSVRLKQNLPLRNEGEKRFAEALQYEQFGDNATAIDKYHSIVELLGDQPEYRPYVRLARRQIGRIEAKGAGDGEAERIIQSKLNEADALMQSGRPGSTIAARKIWDSIVELYGDNAALTRLVEQAQNRRAGAGRSSTGDALDDVP